MDGLLEDHLVLTLSCEIITPFECPVVPDYERQEYV